MKVCIELRTSKGSENVTKKDLQENINQLNVLINSTKIENTALLDSTRSILKGLQQNVPEY